MGRIIKTNNLEIDYDEITREDMPNEMFEEIFDINGKDVALSLLEHQTGVFISVPARPFFKLERRLMIKDFDGSTASIRRISRKYKVAESVVRETLKKANLKVPEEGQLYMFD